MSHMAVLQSLWNSLTSRLPANREPNADEPLPAFRSSRRDLLRAYPQYKALRKAEQRVADELVAALPTSALVAASNRLGLSQGAKHGLNFDEEAMFIEDALYHYRPDGLNALERCAKHSPPPEGSLESVALRGLVESYFTIVLVRRTLPGFGVELVDIFSGEERILADLAMSTTAAPGDTAAMRLVPIADFWIATGSSVAVIDEPRVLERMKEYCDQRFPGLTDVRSLNADDARDFQAKIVRLVASYDSRAILFARGAENIDDPHFLGRPARVRDRKLRKVGRNETCPCGSGVKYKRCCGRGDR